MKADDKHKWLKDKNYKDISFKEKHVCVKCGCERFSFWVGKFLDYTYMRSKICFGERPVCIDWEKENLKTID